MNGQVAGSIHVDKPKRRAKLTDADRVATVEKMIERAKAKLGQLESRKLKIINEARERVRKAAAEIEQLR